MYAEGNEIFDDDGDLQINCYGHYIYQPDKHYLDFPIPKPYFQTVDGSSDLFSEGPYWGIQDWYGYSISRAPCPNQIQPGSWMATINNRYELAWNRLMLKCKFL